MENELRHLRTGAGWKRFDAKRSFPATGGYRVRRTGHPESAALF